MHFNPFKPLNKNIQELFLKGNSSYEQRNEDELECLQFGICNAHVKSPRPEELFFR